MPDSANQSELYAIELRSAQWEALVTWYRQALGLRSLIRVVDDGYALLVTGGTRIAIMARTELEPASNRITLAFETNNMPESIARLKQTGSIVTEPVTNHEGLTEATTTDPDGNRIRLFSWPK